MPPREVEMTLEEIGVQRVQCNAFRTEQTGYRVIQEHTIKFYLCFPITYHLLVLNNSFLCS